MKKIIFSVLCAGMLTGSCRKDAADNLGANEGIVYITEHDSSANFSTYQRFKVADSVNVVKEGQLQRREYTQYDSALIEAVKRAIAQRGFQLETNTAATPDIGINITRFITEYTGVVSYGDYWGAYDDYWDPYYWGYSGYDYYFPYGFGTYSFREGALSFDMLDLKNPDTTSSKINTVWTGLARGTGIFNSSNINEVVQQLFSQSGYIQR